RRVLVLAAGVARQVSERLVTANVDGSEDDRFIARRIKDVAVEPRLAIALRQRSRDEELELGAEQPDSIRAGQAQHRQIVAQAGVHHHFDALSVARERLDVAELGVSGLALAAALNARLEVSSTVWIGRTVSVAASPSSSSV